MKNLLVPTDFSPESHHAFEVALRLARRTGGNVTLLHVLETPEGASISTSGGVVPNGDGGIEEIFTLKLLEVTKRRLHDLIAEANHNAPGVPVHDVMQMDRIDNAILNIIKHRHIDLVVMGAQGHGALEHFFTGSNTERIIRLATCPVLAVKHQHPNYEVRHIVFPSDFQAEADRAVPGLLSVQAVFPEAKLHLLHVAHDPDRRAAALARMHAFAQRHNLSKYEPTVFDAPNASTGIQQFAQQTDADLVVLPTHARTGFSRFLGAHIAENVATHAFPPVLTFQFEH
jgi:nucleotide-binding universal stress UspA family protein